MRADSSQGKSHPLPLVVVVRKEYQKIQGITDSTLIDHVRQFLIFKFLCVCLLVQKELLSALRVHLAWLTALPPTCLPFPEAYCMTTALLILLSTIEIPAEGLPSGWCRYTFEVWVWFKTPLANKTIHPFHSFSAIVETNESVSNLYPVQRKLRWDWFFPLR